MAFSLILRLPPELLIHVAGKLTALPDLAALISTCQSARNVLTPLLYSLAARHHNYLLSWACEVGNLGLATRLLEAGVDPNQPFCDREARIPKTDRDGMKSDEVLYDTAYNHSKHKQRYHEMRELRAQLQYHQEEDENPPEGEGWPSQNRGRVGWLPPVPSYKWYALHCAAAGGHLGLIDLLVRHGAKLDVRAKRFCECSRTSPSAYGVAEKQFAGNYSPSWTPLHTAICFRRESAAQMLISAGSDLELDHVGPNMEPLATALHHAAANGLLSIMGLLVNERGLDVNARDFYNCTPLFYALEGSCLPRTLPRLLQLGADISADLGEGCNLLHVACITADAETALALINRGASINAPWKHDLRRVAGDVRPLDVCCLMGSNTPPLPPKLRSISDPRLSPDEALSKRAQIAMKLIEAGANLETCPGSSWSPVEMASQHESPTILAALDRAGVTFETESSLVSYALWPPALPPVCGVFTITRSRFEINHDPLPCLTWLLNKGAPISNEDGRLFASLFNYLKPSPRLISDHKPQPPAGQKLTVLELLLDHGLDPNLTSVNTDITSNPLRCKTDDSSFDQSWKVDAPLVRFLWEDDNLPACQKLIERGAAPSFAGRDIFGEAVAEIPRGLADPRAHAGMGLGNGDIFREADSSRWGRWR